LENPAEVDSLGVEEPGLLEENTEHCHRPESSRFFSSDHGNPKNNATKMARNVLRDGVPRYARKVVRTDLDPDQTSVAIIDIACEARFLVCLSHTSIIRLRGTIGEPGTPSFGLVLDRMVMTLGEMLTLWRKDHQDRHGKRYFLANTFRSKKEKRKEDEALYGDRLCTSLDIARALAFLHTKKIIYRDLKPENVGFDVRGNAKIFDFGLAKELKQKDLREDTDGFEATGLTGSRRYMAPEVVTCNFYGFSADVYSFSILLWEVFSLKTPFGSCNANELYRFVIEKKKRPCSIIRLLSTSVHTMMEQCWNENRRSRLSMEEVCAVLQADFSSRVLGDNGSMDRSKLLRDVSLMSIAA
jgi:serine/threonine protein kinase